MALRADLTRTHRELKALADGETNPAALAALADGRLRATPEQLCDALGACAESNAVYRRLLKMALEELRLIDEQIGELDMEMANLLSQHQDAVERLAEVPGLGVDSAQQIIAEVGPTAATFPSEKCLPGTSTTDPLEAFNASQACMVNRRAARSLSAIPSSHCASIFGGRHHCTHATTGRNHQRGNRSTCQGQNCAGHH